MIQGTLSNKAQKTAYEAQTVNLPVSLLANGSFMLPKQNVKVRCVGNGKYSFEARLAKLVAAAQKRNH